MTPKYVSGQYYLVDKFSYRFTDPKRGDVIILRSPVDTDKDLIKRIIGAPGDSISLRNGELHLNDEALDETSYLMNDTLTFGGVFINNEEVVTIPPDEYFVLGDNRAIISDSREWGFIPRKDIIGKVVFCYYNCNPSE